MPQILPYGDIWAFLIIFKPDSERPKSGNCGSWHVACKTQQFYNEHKSIHKSNILAYMYPCNLAITANIKIHNIDPRVKSSHIVPSHLRRNEYFNAINFCHFILIYQNT